MAADTPRPVVSRIDVLRFWCVMKIIELLCRVGLHSWAHEVEAKRYRHNKRFDKTKNALTAAKPLAQKCARCGQRRVWSFRRGCWRPADPGRDMGYEVAMLDSVGPLEAMPEALPAIPPLMAPAIPREMTTVLPTESPSIATDNESTAEVPTEIGTIAPKATPNATPTANSIKSAS